jgi:hypothetical protein
MNCYTCGKPVDPEYSVVFRWWEATRVHHPSCIHTFEVGTPVSRHLASQQELLPPEWVRNALATVEATP